MSDPTPQLDVSKHRRRRRLLVGVGGVMFVVVVLFGSRNSEGVLDGGAEAAMTWAIVVAIVIAMIAVIMPILNGERRRLARRASEARPGSTIISGNASADTKLDAPEGVSRRGMRIGGGPLVIALLPQTIEVWSRGDAAPRWTIDRAKAEVAVGYQRNGNASALGIFISDGAQTVRFLPADDSLGMFNEVGRVESALRALGEDPERHLKRS